MDDGGLTLLGHCQPAAPEYRQHRLILRQNIRLELQQALIASNENQVHQDQAGNPASVLRVRCDERQLGTARDAKRLLRTVAPPAQYLLGIVDPHRNHQRDHMIGIDLG